MECPECGKKLKGEIRKDIISYTCEECHLILSDLEEIERLKPKLKIKELVKLVFRDSDSDQFKVRDTFLTTIIPENGSLIRFNSDIFRVSKKVYHYSYIEDGDTTDITVDVFLEIDNSLIYVEKKNCEITGESKHRSRNKRKANCSAVVVSSRN